MYCNCYDGIEVKYRRFYTKILIIFFNLSNLLNFSHFPSFLNLYPSTAHLLIYYSTLLNILICI